MSINQPVIFLDRDGVIIEEGAYIYEIKDIKFIEGSLEALAKLDAAGLKVVLVTNQSGIGRGFFTEDEFHVFQNEINSRIEAAGGKVSAVYFAPHHKDGKGKYKVENHPDRKPEPGMLLRAQKDLGIDLENSIIVGDRPGDIQAGKSAGLKSAYLVQTGFYSKFSGGFKTEDYQPQMQVNIVKNLSEAVHLLLS